MWVRLYKIHRTALEKLARGDLASSVLLDVAQMQSDNEGSASDSDAAGPKGIGKKKARPHKNPPNLPVVKVPQSKYIYVGKSVNVETPQLRDMGEATPSLEWLGLNMERLPQVTHQYVVVTLLEVAKTVEDRYWKILGS